MIIRSDNNNTNLKIKFAVPTKFCRSFQFQILRGLLLVPREIEKKTYAKVCGENQSIDQSINQSINLLTSIRGMGLPRSSEPEAHVKQNKEIAKCKTNCISESHK